MKLLKSIREQYAVGQRPQSISWAIPWVVRARTTLGGKYNDIWAGLAAISGAGGIADGGRGTLQVTADADHARRQGLDRAAGDLRAGAVGRAAGPSVRPHIYLEFPDEDSRILDSTWRRATWRKSSCSSAWCRSGPPSHRK